MPGPVLLEGEKVELRTIEKEDIEFLRDGVNHPEVRVNTLNRRPQNLEDEEEFFKNVIKEAQGIHLLITREGEEIGMISLEQEDRETRLGELGLWLHPEFHGKGYGTEATKLVTDHGFEQLNYHKMYARAHAKNEASKSLWKKLGFEKEGEFKDHAYTEGEYRDVIYYGLLEGDRQ